MDVRTLFGLPAHPLIVHIPVVLVPLAAVGALLIVGSRRLRTSLGWWVVGLAFLSVIGSQLATSSGESLQESVTPSATVRAHVSQTGSMTLFAALFFLLTTALMVWHTWRGRTADERGPFAAVGSTATAVLDRLPAVLGIVLAVLCLGSGALATFKVIEIGHSGAKATWTNNPNYRPGAGG